MHKRTMEAATKKTRLDLNCGISSDWNDMLSSFVGYASAVKMTPYSLLNYCSLRTYNVARISIQKCLFKV